MIVNTTKLKKMLSHVNKIKPNSLLEITNYIELDFNNNNQLVIKAYDGSNYMTVIDDNNLDGDRGSVIVKTDQFTKLVNKTTADQMTLKVFDDYLKVKGNGTYKVEIVNGEIFPDYEIDESLTKYEGLTPMLKHGIQAAKNAKSLNAADGVLYGFLLRDNKITTSDAMKVCVSEFESEGIEALLPPVLAGLVNVLDGDNVRMLYDQDREMMTFIGKSVTISGPTMDGVEGYPNIVEIAEAMQPSICTIDTQEIIQALDRLGLFVGPYDLNLIKLAFVDDNITIQTDSGSIETIEYKDGSGHIEDIVYTVNRKLLYELVAAVDSPSIQVGYGDPDLIKLESDKDIMLLSISDEM